MERFRDEASNCDSVTVCDRFEIFANFSGERSKFRENFGLWIRGRRNIREISGIEIIWGNKTGKNTPDTA
jgi:hypothetical protein